MDTDEYLFVLAILEDTLLATESWEVIYIGEECYTMYLINQIINN